MAAAARVNRVVLGTMSFGWQGMTTNFVNQAIANDILNEFVDFHDEGQSVEIDTALLYASGLSEKMLGEWYRALDSSVQNRILIAGKCHPSITPFSYEGIREQLLKSSESVGTTFHTYYLHQPCLESMLPETSDAMIYLQEEGLFQHLGMSNYHINEVNFMQTTKLKPKTVQLMYNPFTRIVEHELIPVLQEDDEGTFLAYNILAGGLLTGKHSKDSPQSRFSGENYFKRFWNDENFENLEKLSKVCAKYDLSLTQVVYSWLLMHSAIRPGVDGILLGASSVEQLRESLHFIKFAETLPEDVVEVIDSMQNLFPPAYFRGFSGLPGSDASGYSAQKSTTEK